MYIYYDDSHRTIMHIADAPSFLTNPLVWWRCPQYCCPTMELLNLKTPPKVSIYNADR